jgi:Fis family transcriptional regulator, factor for inversion stimulation protein
MNIEQEKTQIAHSIEASLDTYFSHLDGEAASGVYDLVMGCAEHSVLRYVMNKAQQNQSVAAEILGLNRNTLRSKLIKHNLK